MRYGGRHSTRRVEEVFHRGRDFDDMGLDRKMPGVKKLNLRSGYVLPKGFGSRWQEEWVVLAPDREQGRLRFAEIFLEFRVQLDVRRVIQKQIELNLFVPRAFEQRRIQSVRLRRNTLRIRYAVGVLPARSARRQNTLAEDVSIFWSGRGPIFADGSPGIAKPFFVRVPILRNNRRDPLGMGHRQPEPGRRAVVEHVNCVTVEFQSSREGLDRQSQL